MDTWIIFVGLCIISFAIASLSESLRKLKEAWERESAKTQAILADIRERLPKPKQP